MKIRTALWQTMQTEPFFFFFFALFYSSNICRRSEASSVGNNNLLLSLCVNLEGHTEFVCYNTISRAKKSFLQRFTPASALMRSISRERMPRILLHVRMVLKKPLR